MPLSKEKHEGLQNETAWGAGVAIGMAVLLIFLRQFGIDVDVTQLPEFLQPVALPAIVLGAVTFAARMIVWWVNRQIKK